MACPDPVPWSRAGSSSPASERSVFPVLTVELIGLIQVGDFLKAKYDSATEVRLNKRGKLQVRNRKSVIPTAEDLVFLDSSPDYCSDNSNMGTFGTHGRACNKSSKGPDGCGVMCCGRGYTVQKQVVKQRCNCRFNWCCFVKCDTCAKPQEIHTCK